MGDKILMILGKNPLLFLVIGILTFNAPLVLFHNQKKKKNDPSPIHLTITNIVIEEGKDTVISERTLTPEQSTQIKMTIAAQIEEAAAHLRSEDFDGFEGFYD